MSRFFFAAMLAVTAATVSVRAAEQSAANTNFPSRAAMRPDLLKEFDKDGDGKLNDEERKAMMAARHAQMEKFMKAREKEFDKDGDGKLNDEERKAMMVELQKRRANGPQYQEMIKRFDKDGDGKLNDEERAAMMAELQKRRANDPRFQEMLKRFDKDGDGKLNDEERKAMMAEQAKRMQQKDVNPPAAPAPAAPAPAKAP